MLLLLATPALAGSIGLTLAGFVSFGGDPGLGYGLDLGMSYHGGGANYPAFTGIAGPFVRLGFADARGATLGARGGARCTTLSGLYATTQAELGLTLHPSGLPALYVGALGTAGWLSAFAEGRLAWEYDGDAPVRLIGDAGAGVQLAVGGWSRVSAGRPLRAKGRIVLPGAAAHVDASPAFVQAARAEWASVPTFLRLGSELRLLGAPPVLVGRSFTAAQDEIQHTADCLTMAGAPVVLGPLPAAPPRLQPRRDWLLRLAAESEIDGVLGEGAAADTLAREASMCRDESTARRIDRMATEERDHSNLAKDVVAWAQHELR